MFLSDSFNVLVTSIANCERLVPSRKRRPSHCPSVPRDDRYTFKEGCSSKLNTWGVAPLRAIPVRGDGVRTFKAYAPNTGARFGGNPQQPRPGVGHGSVHNRPTLTVPVQDPHRFGFETRVVTGFEEERPRGPDVVWGQGAQCSDCDTAWSDGRIGDGSP